MSDHENTSEAVARLAKACELLTQWEKDVHNEGPLDLVHDVSDKLDFASHMCHAIAHNLELARASKETIQIWRELSSALSDTRAGKSSRLLQPIRDSKQPKRISVAKETWFGIAAGVYDLANPEERPELLREIANKLEVKPTQLEVFRKNLTRGNPNIKSETAIELYDGVTRGILIATPEGQILPGNGSETSPIKNWLKAFDKAFVTEV